MKVEATALRLAYKTCSAYFGQTQAKAKFFDIKKLSKTYAPFHWISQNHLNLMQESLSFLFLIFFRYFVGIGFTFKISRYSI